METEELQC